MQEPGSDEPQEDISAKKSTAADMLSPAARGFIKDYWEQAKFILLHPQEFFKTMPVEGGYRDPLIFLCLSAGVNALLSGIIGFSLMRILLFPLSFVGVTLGAYVASFLAQAMGGKGSFQATFRVMVYSEAALLFTWVPVLGIFPGLYIFVLNFFGLRQVHGISDVKTVSVVLLSGIVSSIIIGLAACGVFIRSVFHI